MWIAVLVLAAFAFVGYAVYTQYSVTPIGDSVPKRVWASIVAAGAAVGAALMAWVHHLTGP
jgi:hypothetical protein